MLKHAFVLGVDHQKASAHVREKLSQLPVQHIPFAKGDEHFILSTCNRYEVYGVLSPEVSLDEARDKLHAFFAEHSGLSLDVISHMTYHKHGEEMLRHGFRVASSLESMVVGEPQILGQMKEAYRRAKDQGTVQGFLERFCAGAFRVGKRVRSETLLARESVSIASTSVKLAEDIFGDLSPCRVLVVGAGDMSLHAARHLRKAGVKHLCVTNRTLGRAHMLAQEFDAEVMPFDDLEGALAQADIVLTGTSSPEAVITHDMVRRVMKQRKQRRLFFVDMALPRDVAPEVNAIANAYLYDIDQLADVARQSLGKRHAHADAARAIIDEEVNAFLRWSEEKKNIHMLMHLRHTLEDVQAQVLKKYKSEEAAEATRLLLNKVLHHPTKAIKRGAIPSDDLEYMLATFFGTKCPRIRVLPPKRAKNSVCPVEHMH